MEMGATSVLAEVAAGSRFRLAAQSLSTRLLDQTA